MTRLHKDLLAIIQQRHSSRTYLVEPIDPSIRAELLTYIQMPQPGLFQENFHFQLIERNPRDQRRMKFDYGFILNHHNYLLDTIQPSIQARLSYGYAMEKVVLKATQLNLGTCWMGYFDPEYFTEIKLTHGLVIPSIVVVGHTTEKPRVKERLIRYVVKAAKRHPWEKQFFIGHFSTPITPKQAGKYSAALEATRLAPSSGNTQPWRIIKESDKNIFHFFKQIINPRYEQRSLHDIDLGICMAHFEIIASDRELKGSWKYIPTVPIQIPAELHYMLSWSDSP